MTFVLGMNCTCCVRVEFVLCARCVLRFNFGLGNLHTLSFQFNNSGAYLKHSKGYITWNPEALSIFIFPNHIYIYILKLLYFNTFQRTHNYPDWFWCATPTTDSWIIRVYELAHERVLHIFFQVTDWFERDTLRPSYRHAPIYHEDLAIKIVWPTLSYLWVLCLERSVMEGTVGLYNLVWPVSRFRGCCLQWKTCPSILSWD